MTSIKLLWGAFEYLELEQTYVWTLWTFIAAVGGSIGMWLGLSVLTLIQVGKIVDRVVPSDQCPIKLIS